MIEFGIAWAGTCLIVLSIYIGRMEIDYIIMGFRDASAWLMAGVVLSGFLSGVFILFSACEMADLL